jgi:ribonuclease P protein component
MSQKPFRIEYSIRDASRIHRFTRFRTTALPTFLLTVIPILLCFLVLYLPSSEKQSRIGITVSKKVGNAVVRNRVKRWIREASRMEYSILKGFWDIVVIAYPQSKTSSLVQLKLDIRSVFLFLSKKSQ